MGVDERPDQPLFTQEESERVARLDRALYDAYGPGGSSARVGPALRCYLETLSVVRRRIGMFEIANHRVFRCEDRLIVPYDVHGCLLLHSVGRHSSHELCRAAFPYGTLFTDRLIFERAGCSGEAVDLDREIYHLDVDDTPGIQVARLRDLARLLHRLNHCGSRHEAVYLLRFLVARLCSNSYRGVVSAKNLLPEVLRVRNELIEFMNGPFADRLRLPTRLLVRNISGLVSSPKLIDEVWQDTIDLCEILVRGSAITNEIRRSTHHALGKQTLELARAYRDWLDGGAPRFPDPERNRPSSPDHAARRNPAVRELVDRIVHDLDQLLGSGQIASRLREWQESYAVELLLCPSTHSLTDELDSLLNNGIQAQNRWTYQLRVRNLLAKASEGGWPPQVKQEFEVALERLLATVPGDPGFQAGPCAKQAREAVERFAAGIRGAHQDPLFEALDAVLSRFEAGSQLEAFEQCCELRRTLESRVGSDVFPGQRYLLHQLDCVLEELGFFALRHVASGYPEQGIPLKECLRITFLCAGNLERDGLYSRELWDLCTMLVNPARTESELLDVLEQIQRSYHRLVLRVSEAYETMAEHLGYDADEMRAVQGNFQRTMHDLNNLVYFSDLARVHISEHRGQLHDLGSGARGSDPWDFVHLSHEKDIRRRVRDDSAPSLQARYGGKGSGLIYISYLGIPTRDAFIIPTVLPRLGLHRSQPRRLDAELLEHLAILEEDIRRDHGQALRLGDPSSPLLLAVRGGSVFSMPGMLATVVFVGMTRAVAEALAREDEWFAWDAFRRFLASYAAAVWQLDLEAFDLVEKAKRARGVTLKTDLSGEAMREVVERSIQLIRDAGHSNEMDRILNDAEWQLKTAMRAVHASWDGERAKRYRRIKHLSDAWQTAVIVQQMACGNRSNQEDLRPGMNEMEISLTGVIPFTRMTASGFRVFTGDVKFSACGDDLVGGLTAARSFEPVRELRAQAPMLERKLNHISARLRRFLGSDTEIEFTVDRGVLSILQIRSAQMELHYSPRTFSEPGTPLGHGIGISGGAFRGVVVFHEQQIEEAARVLQADPAHADGVLLVLENPIPDEIPLILSVDGLLSARGGSTSHAAVAIHGIDDRPYAAVLGVAELKVFQNEAILVDRNGEPTQTIRAGDVLSIHGQTGDVFAGSLAVKSTDPDS